MHLLPYIKLTRHPFHSRDAPTTIIPANALDFLQRLYFREMFHLESHSSGCLQRNSKNMYFHLFSSSGDARHISTRPKAAECSDKVLLPGGKWASLVLMMSSEGRQWSVSELQRECVDWQVRPAGARPPDWILFLSSHNLNCSCTQSAMRRERQTKEEERKKKVSPNPLFRCSRQSRPSILTPHLS